MIVISKEQRGECTASCIDGLGWVAYLGEPFSGDVYTDISESANEAFAALYRRLDTLRLMLLGRSPLRLS